MTIAADRERFGLATLDPDGEIVAGSYGTWKLSYTAGSEGVAPGGSIRVDTDSDTDWAIPQFQDPAGADYMTVEAPAKVHVGVLNQSVTSLVLLVHGCGLMSGEKVILVYGDHSGGGPGSRAQTFVEAKRYFRVAVDTNGSGAYTELTDSPCVSIVGGPADRLIVVAPSTASVGDPFRLMVKAEDAWGNPSADFAGSVELSADGVELAEQTLAFQREHDGVRWIEGCTPSRPGIYRITARDTTSALEAKSNPIVCTDKPEPYGLYWGDYHGGQVAMAEKIAGFFRYARDVAAIQFASYQRNDHAVSKSDWEIQQRAEREFHQPGRFVAIPGFEWSPRTEEGGHHNVYFRRHNQPIRRSSRLALRDRSDVDTDIHHVTDLYRTYRGTDTVITPHVGGEHSDLNHHDPGLEPAVEVTSTHGSFEWFLRETLEHGYKLGFFGGSDSHTGRPGDDRPGHQHRRYAKAGLAAVYATDVSLEALLEALKARRCYATTGARIVLHTEMDGHPMGSEPTTHSPPRISVSVIGTAPLESVELFRGLETLHTHPLTVAPARNRVRILWEGASRKSSYSGVVWDGTLNLDGARITAVEKLRFDSPRSDVPERGESSLRWHSVTCGYRSGVILDLNADPDAELRLAIHTSLITGPTYGGHGETGPRRISYAPAERVSLSVSLRELREQPMEIDIGLLERKVTVSLAPGQSAPDTAEFTFTDPSPVPGVNPYWVRVVQTDMEMAWSSPIFVDYAPPGP